MTEDRGLYLSDTIGDDGRLDIGADPVLMAQADTGQEAGAAPAAASSMEFVPDSDNRVTLGADVSLEEIRLDGDDLLLIQPDGTQVRVIGGALNLPTFIIGDIEIPQDVLVAALNTNGFNVAAGPGNTVSVSAQAPTGSGGDFQDSSGASLQGDGAPTLALLGDSALGSGDQAGEGGLQDPGNIAARLTGGGIVTGAVVESADVPGGVDADPFAATGAVTFFDPDFGETRQADVSARAVVSQQLNGGGSLTTAQLQGLLDGFALDTAGGVTVESTSAAGGTINWTYALANGALDFLGAGETVTLSFDVRIRDGIFSTTQTVTLTVTGTNDAPVITSRVQSGLVDETADVPGGLDADPASVSGTISFSDVDLSDDPSASHDGGTVTGVTLANGSALTAAQVAALKAGFSLADAALSNFSSVTGAGSTGWTYQIANGAADFLGAADSVQLTFRVTINDQRGGTIAQDVVITVTGTNDVPVVAAGDVTGGVTERVTPAGDITDTGTIAFTDVDLSDTHTINPAIAASTGALGTLTASVTSDTTGTGTGGVISWNYRVTASAVEYLAAGETKIETFTITLSDGRGGTVERTISVTITGTNDVPLVASEDVTGAVTEQVTPAWNLTDSGTIAFTDVDLGDTHTINPAIAASTGALGALTASVTSDTTGTGTGGIISWSYSVAASAVEYLALNETKVETFTITLSDGRGGTVERTISVTITGTNDVPVVASEDVTGAVTEQVTPAGNLTDSGTIAFTDVDLLDIHTVLPGIVASNGALGTLTANVTTDTTGTGTGGVIGWSYSVAASAVEYLALNETKIETFTITLSDGRGGTVERTISVTITGTNDVPVVAAGDVTGAVTEQVTPAGNLTDSGTIAFTDVDLSDTHTVLPGIVASNGALGALTANVTVDTTGTGTGGVISWSYSVAASAVEYLALNETKVETFTITLSDGRGGTVERTISVTITGTNDVPLVASED
ncbi:VCBS domain-containing protein, partial [Hoeflea sp. BAL378]|uniref:beta strand repeat-containing protein n=1 Tax=Hoeflea sp. BAL378 TaxID=1547437 RepID=UPI00191BFAFB